MSKIKDYWQIVTICVAVLAFGWWLKNIDAKAEEARSAARQQAEINVKLTALIVSQDKEMAEANARLQVYLELMGFSDSTAQAWAAMPREAPHDSLGKPVPWVEWLRTDSGLSVGEALMFDDSGTVLVQPLWDFRSEGK